MPLLNQPNQVVNPTSFDFTESECLWTPAQSVVGAEPGQFQLNNLTRFGYQPNSERTSVIGHDIGNAGQSLDTVVVGAEGTIQLTFDRANAMQMAANVMGVSADMAAGAEAITDEIVSLTGGLVKLSRFDVTAASLAVRGVNLTVDDSTGFVADQILTNSTTGELIGLVVDAPDGTHIRAYLSGFLPNDGDVITNDTQTATIAASGVAADNAIAVLDTDFEFAALDESRGWFRIIETGGLDKADLSKVKVNYTSTKFAGSQISLATYVSQKGALAIKGYNAASSTGQKKFLGIFSQISISPDQILNLIAGGTDRAEFSLNGVPETPAGESSPGYFRIEQ